MPSTTPASDADIYFTHNHEYVRVEGSRAIIGLTDFAIEKLGEITFIELPEVGDTLSAGDTVVTVEAGDLSCEFNMPVSGLLIAVNQQLEEEPNLLENSPFGDGWLAELELNELSELEALMDEAAYQQWVATL